MYRQTRSSFVTVVLTATHSSPPKKRKKKCGKGSPDCHMTVFNIHFFELSWACLGPRKQPIRWTGGKAVITSGLCLIISEVLRSSRYFLITQLRMSLNQLPGDTQGFVWKFFYALYINFHSLIQAIDNLPWKTRKALTKVTSAALKPGRWDCAHMAFHKSIKTILSWTVVIVDKTGFWHLPSNSARMGYTSEGAFCICANCALTLSEPSKRFGY